jgi:hypothetical protein
VTKYPPTTLIIAKMIAISPKIVCRVPSCRPATMRAPMMVIPEIALEPDISGVWSRGGTLVMTANPKNIAITKMYSAAKSASVIRPPYILYCYPSPSPSPTRRGELPLPAPGRGPGG